MVLRAPKLSPTAIVSDDPYLAAALSSALACSSTYLAVLEGPRMTRSDKDAEIVTRNNALARLNTRAILLAGLTSEAQSAMLAKLPKRSTFVVSADDVPSHIRDSRIANRPTLKWGNDQIGIGLLKALYGRQLIEFSGAPSPIEFVPSKATHLVVCEKGEPLAEVIAANYAFALRAGLFLIDPVDKTEADEILESYYSIDAAGSSPGYLRSELKHRLREICGNIPLEPNGSLTFVTRSLPFGVAFPEVPSTHLFSYPNLGVSVANGFSADQPTARGTNVAVLVDPEKVRAPEIAAATKLLPRRGIFVRGYRGRGATVQAVSDMVEFFPYDILIFATHCGDTSGSRWTYKYKDREGIDRTLVVDVAVGIGTTDNPDLYDVKQYTRFHSIDGIDWSDSAAKNKHYIGDAILDYVEKFKDDQKCIVSKEPIARVAGSAAMAMSDHLYLAVSHSLAANGSPIIINNACASWHELAERFTFANARAYVGTLYPVSDVEAEAVAVRLFDKFFGKPLAHALWAAQNAAYGPQSDRRPYVITGVYPQRFRATREHTPRWIMGRLLEEARAWKARLSRGDITESMIQKRIEGIFQYYAREADAFGSSWFPIKKISDDK